MEWLSLLTTNNSDKRIQVEIISIDQLVPEDHLVRKLDACIDFSFIYDLVKDKYSTEIGRPSIDPIVLFKIAFTQYIFGIKSMRQAISEIQTNMAYLWFLGYGLNDKIPHFTTFGKNYVRRFQDTDIFEKIFMHILEQAVDAGYISKLMIDQGIRPVMPYTRPRSKDGYFRKYEYVYDEYYDCYICPNDQISKYSTTNRDGYREYKSDPNVCCKCPYLNKCTSSKKY